MARDLEVARSLLESTSGRVDALLDSRRSTVVETGLKTAAWLAQEPRQAVAGCRRRLRVARRLRNDFTRVETAVAQGRLSWDHAEVIERVSNRRIRAQLIEIQDSLIESADGVVFEHWEQFVVGLARQLDADGGHDPAADLSSNKLSTYMDSEGALVINGELVGAEALEVQAAIRKVSDELFAKYSKDAEVADEDLPVPDRATLRALALAEICRRANNVSTGRMPVNLTTLIVHSDDPSNTAYTPDGGVFPNEMVSLLRCDETIEPLVVSSNGVPLHLGRARRLATAEQRRVIAVRDGGCVFPGCAEPTNRCKNHHVNEWHRDMGLTNTDEMAALCPHHHGVVHSRGWSMKCEVGEWFEFITPGGKRLVSQRHHSTRGHPKHCDPASSAAEVALDSEQASGDPPGHADAA